MRWIALALLASLAAAIWWFDAPWPTRSVQWDQRYAAAADRADCEAELALIRVGIEADYPPAATALGELAERNACGYRSGQFDFEEEDASGAMIPRNVIERLSISYAQANEQLRRDLNNGWFLRTRIMAWLDRDTDSPNGNPHAALLDVVQACSDQLMAYDASPHWAALEATLRDAPLDPHRTSAEHNRRRLVCREVLYAASLTLRAASDQSLRIRGVLMQSQAADWGQSQAIAECLDFIPPPAETLRDPQFEPVLYCPSFGPHVPDWVALGYPAARTAWLDSLEPYHWPGESDAAFFAATPVWVAIHATIANHSVREAALSQLPQECEQVVNEVAARVERLQNAELPSAGIQYDEGIRQAWQCEPESLRAMAQFDAYYPPESFPAVSERWDWTFAPAGEDAPAAAR
tara:strand:- start:236 stop:1456 length:1221 start_codon:yes stop_codon:yes gene_type:complete